MSVLTRLTCDIPRSCSFKFLFNQVRQTSKINLRYPAQPNFRKKLLFATCEPVPKINTSPSYETCDNLKKEVTEIHPYVKLLADEFKDNLNSRFVAFYHLSPRSFHQYLDAKNLFFRNGYTLELYDKEIAEAAFQDPNYKIFRSFYNGEAENAIAFTNKIDIKKFTTMQKNLPKPFILMFAIIDGRIINNETLKSLNTLPSMKMLFQQIVLTLTTAIDITNSLYRQQQLLCNNLQNFSNKSK